MPSLDQLQQLERHGAGGDRHGHQEADPRGGVAAEAEERAAVMVMPDRDVPGFSASTWAAPTISGVVALDSRRACACRLRRSAHASSRPNTISEMAMMAGVPSCLSIVFSNTRADHRRRDRRQHEQPGQPALGRGRSFALERPAGRPSRTYTTRSLRK